METNYQRNNEKCQWALNIAWQKGVSDVRILVTASQLSKIPYQKKFIRLRLRVATDMAQLPKHRTEIQINDARS